MKKKFAIVFLSLFLVVSLPFAAHANIVTATGKYLINAVKKIPGGAKVEATNTVTGAKHVINHGVSASALGTAIGGGIVGFGVATGAGLAFKAITGLALDAVDWVMDPANNRVKWKDKGGGDPAGNYVIGCPEGVICSKTTYIYKLKVSRSAELNVCKYLASTTTREGDVTVDGKSCRVARVYSVGSIETVEFPASDIEWQYVPFNDLAKKIINLADGGNAVAQKDIEDYVTHLAKEGKLDTELDNAPDITQPENPEEPNPEEPQECPSGSVKVDDVCVKIPDSDGDEPLFCDSSEFTKKVCDWIDWTQIEHDELEPDAGKVDITDKSKDLNIDRDRIDFTNQCPAPTPINTSVGGFPVSTELNYQPLCDFFTMLNPFVIGMGGISSALIIAGGARRG